MGMTESSVVRAPLSLLRQAVKYFAAVAGVGAALVLVLSWYFHTTSVEVQARVSNDVAAAIADGAAITLELHDAPLGGELLERFELSSDDVAVLDGTTIVEISKRTRTLPDNSHIQLCIDPDGDGHVGCSSEEPPDDGQLSDVDVVSCTRQQLTPNRRWFSSTSVSYANANCQQVQAPLLAGPGSGTVTVDDAPTTLAFVDEADVSQLINQALIDFEQGQDAQLTLDDVELFVAGIDHDDDQRLVLNATELTITNGNSIDLSTFLDNTDTNTDNQVIGASLNGTTLTVSLTNGGTSVVELSSLTTDTDDQQLSLGGNTLVLSNGDDADSAVDLSRYLDDTDTLSALSCSNSEFVVWSGSAWACTNVNDLETLTTVGYDVVTQTVTYTNEDGVATSIPIATLETTTVLNNTLSAGNIIGSYTNEDGSEVDILETVTTLVDNGDGTFSYISEDGTISSINASSLETLTTVTNTISAGNLIATYTDEDGASFDIQETITAVVDNGDGTFSFTHEDGSVSTLDAASLETLTTLTSVVAGNTIATYTDEDGVAWDIDESITTLVDNGDQTVTFTHEDGNSTTLDIAALETLTTVNQVVVGNTIATYVDEDGGSWNIDETITTLVDNGDGTFSFTHEDGSLTTINAASLETLTTVNQVVVGNTIATYVDEEGVSWDIDETITTLVDNGDGTFSFTHEDGSTTTLNAASLETLTSVTNTITGNTIATYIDEDGVATDIDETITTLVDNGDQTVTFIHEDGSTSTLDLAALETLTALTNTVEGNLIGTYTDEDGVAFDIDETITTLIDNGDQTVTFTHEDGSLTTLDLAALETLTSVAQLVTGNTIATYTDEDGVVWDIDESITTLIDNGDQTFTYTSEDGSATTLDVTALETLTTVTNTVPGSLIATYTDEEGVSWDVNETITTLVDNGDGTFTFSHEDGSTTTLDASSLETLTSVAQLVTGNTIATYTDEDGVVWDIDETITALVDNGDQTFTYTNEAGVATTLDATALETLTTVTNTITGNTIATYTDEDGVSFDIDETITSLADNGDGTFTFTHEDGLATTIDAASLETLTTVTQLVSGNTIATYIDEDGVATDIDETITTLVDNGDQTVTFTHEDGSTTTLDIASLETLTTVTNTLTGGSLIGTYTDEDGDSFDIEETITTLVDNGDGSFTYTAEGGVATTIDAASLETLTTLTSTIVGNTIGTYTDEDGVAFDIDETITSLVDNGDGTFTFTHEDGLTSTIDAASLETLTTVTNTIVGNTIATYTDEDGVAFDIDETVTDLVDNGDGTFTFTHEGGVTSTIDAASLETLTTLTSAITGNTIGTYTDEDGVTFDIDETITTLVDNGDGTFTFTAEGGAITTIDAASLETLTAVTQLVTGNTIATYTDEDGVVWDIDETITALVDNDDQTFTYTNEAGVATTLDVTALETLTTVTNTLTAGNLIGTYTDEDAVSFDLTETITTLVDNGDGTFTFTAEGGAVTTIDAASLETLTTVTNTISGNTIATYTDEDGVSFDIDETITSLVDNGDGTFTFTHEDGLTTTIDAASLETLTAVAQLVTGNTIATYTDEDGVVWDIDETITTLVDNGDGTFTFTAEGGAITTIDAASLETLTTVTQIVTGNAIASYTDEDGVSLDIEESITSLVDNGDGTFSFFAEDGSESVIDGSGLETLTSVNQLVTGNVIAEYVAEDGTVFEIEESITTLADNGDGTFSFFAEDGTESVIDGSALETVTSVNQIVTGNVIAEYIGEDGTIFDIEESITTLADNGDGTFTFTGEDGTVTTVDTLDIETLTTLSATITGNLIGTYTNEAGASVDLNETITTLADNGDGTFTFTGEDGTVTTVDTLDIETITSLASTLSVGNLIGTYTNEAGASVDLNETITTLVDNGDGTFTFTSESGAVTTIDTTDLETLTAITNVLTTGQRIATYTNEAGASIDILESVTELVDNGDGTYSFTSEDGTLSTITDGDVLGSLNCAVGETAQWSGTAWACAADNDTDTDDQTLSNFTLTGSTLEITIEDGNTVTVDLSSLDTDTDTDDQALTLTGSVLSISEGNSVDLAALVATGDSQTLSVSGGTITISNGNSIDFPVLTIYEETFAAGTDDGLTQSWARNARMGRNSAGFWTVQFAFPHPDGTDYAIAFSVEEQFANRDSILLQVVQGSKTANGFDLFLGTGDNGGTADLLVDTPFTISVDAPIEVLGPAN